MLPLVTLIVSAFLLAQNDGVTTCTARRVAARRPKAGEDCVLALMDKPANLPLLTNQTGVIYPTGHGDESNGKIIIAGGKCAVASCPASSNSLQNYSGAQADICCDSHGLKVSPTMKSTSFKQLGCTQSVKEDIGVNGVCFNGFTNISIEFRNTGNKFPLITLCHDETTMNTLFAKNIIYSDSIDVAEISNARPSFKKGQFYGKLAVATAYSQSSQKKMVAELVGSASLAEQYIDTKQSFYFARGHLAPDGDFVYVFEQNATYYYVNVVPQWQSINNGNWKALETAARKLAPKVGKLVVYTGGYQVLQLKDKNDNLVDIYLARDKSTGELVVPAPKLTWKVLYSPRKQAAVAVVMVNNPHMLGVTSADIICKDICNQISWITWDIYNTQKGYTYCCDLSSFQAAVPYAPKIAVTKVLS